jgi:lysozyme
MKLSQAGRDLIAEFEGLRLEAYPDPGTGGEPWTIGVGSTSPKVKPGDTITTEEAWSRFEADIAPCEDAVNRHVTKPLSQNQFDALVSFVFNLGAPNFIGSTLLRRINAGMAIEAGPQFDRWIYANGKVLPGLVRRRKAERALFERTATA